MGDTPYSGGEEQTTFSSTLSAEEMAQLAKIDDAVFTTAQWLFLSLFTIADYYTGPQIDSLLLSHTHDGRYYTEDEIDSMFAEHAALSHTHDDRYYTEDEIDSLLSDKSDTTHNHDLVYAALSHNHDSAYAALSHTHDDRYYTESEITTLLAGKSDSTHNHDSDYADISHTHDEDDLSLSDVTTGDVNTNRHGFVPKLPGGQELNRFLRVDATWAEPESSGGGGDVTGPESAVASDFPSFADTSGKIIQDSGYGPSSFAVAAKGVTNGDDHDHSGGDGAAIAEAALSLSDVTTGNASTTAHGFLKKLPNDAGLYMDGEGNWTALKMSRDLLINGNMIFWQRGTSFSSVTNSAFSADRWKNLIANGSGTAPVFDIALDNTDGINYYMKLTVTASGVAGAGMYATVNQYHEYYNSLKGKTVSARIRVSVPSGKTGNMLIWDGVGGTGVDITGTGAFQEVTVSHTVSTSATVLRVIYYIANGTSFNATAGDIHYIDRIQLTEGATALPFLPYDPILDYVKCRRYCRLLPIYMQIRISQTTANYLTFNIPWLCADMRINPSIVNAVEGTSYNIYNMSNSPQTGFSVSMSYGRIQATKTGHGLTDGFLVITASSIYLDAEL